MVDSKIQTELDIDLKQGNTLSDVKEIASALKQAHETIQGSNLEAADLNSNFRAVLGTLKSASTAMAELKALTQGSVNSVLNRTALTGVRNETKGSDQSIALALAKDEMTVRRQTALVGEKIVENYRIESQIKQGISNLSTLEYQREIALSKIAIISLGNEKDKKKLLGEQATILQNLETGIKSLTNLEANRVAYMKQQEALRKKELADVQRAAVLAEKKAAKEAEQNSKSGGDVVSQINRKSMGELLITQTKLLLNYKLISTALNSFQFGVQYVRELDKSFHELQAIGDLTQTQMNGVKESIIDVASTSKFSAVEVAQAAVTLAQAGYSGAQIEGSIKAITLLAQAAGTDLKTAVDITTSTLNVFNYQVSQTGQVANTLTYALNTSKLSIEQLGLGIQYSANVAADANISFEEMIASFGVLSDAGIRSGSTIGTGYRQLINDIQAPSEKLKTRLGELGLSLEDVNIRSKGLAGVLKTLRDAGFTSADALETLEVRAASTFSAMQQGLDSIGAQERAMMLSAAATKASETQMSSFDSVVKQLQGNLGNLAYSMSQGIVKTLTSLFQAVNSVVVALRPFGGILETLAIVGVGTLITRMVGLGTILRPLLDIVMGVVRGFLGLRTAFTVTAIGLNVLATAMSDTFAVSLWTGWGLVIAGVSAALYGLYKVFSYFSSNTKTVSDAIEENETKINETKATLQQYEAQGRQVSAFLKTLRDQHQLLTTDTDAMKTKTLEAKLAFEGLGGTIINLSDNYETLLAKMVQVRVAVSQQTAIAAGAAAAAQRIAIINTNQAVNSNRENIQKASLGGGFLSFSKDDQNIIRNAVKEGMTDANIRDTDGQSRLISASNSLTRLLENTKDEEGKKYLSNLISSFKPALDGVKSVITATEEVRKNEDKVSSSNFDARTASATAGFLNLMEKFVGPEREALSKASTSSELKRIEDIYRGAANATDRTENLVQSALGIIGLRIPSSSANKEDIEAFKAEMKKKADEIGEVRSKVQQNEVEIALAKNQSDIKRYVAESKVSSLSDRDATIKAIRDAYATQLSLEQQKNAAIVNAPDYVSKLNSLLTDPNAVAEFRKKQLAELNSKTSSEISQKLDKSLQDYNERTGKVNAAVQDGLLPSITALQLKFKSLTDSLELAIKIADSPVKIKEAQISALDVGNNKYNVTDAQRYKAEQELEKLKAVAADQKLAAFSSKVDPLAEQLAQLNLLKADLERQGAAAGINAKDLAGTSLGNQSGQRLKNLQGQYKTTLTEIEKASKASEELNINLALAKAQYDALNTPVQEKPIWDVFNDSLEVYMDQQTKLSKSNAELGRGFTKIFDDINGGFANVVRNFAIGTGSIKSSFKAMAASVISDLLDIASKRASAGIFDSIFGSVVSSLTGSITQSAAPIQGLGQIDVTDLPAIPNAQGGIVRGGIPNRDSVRTKLMPGEAVLTRTAVSMIGEDTVNALNSSGSRVSSQSTPQQMDNGSNKSEPMVQNIYLVDDRNQIPGLGEKDVVMIVSDNLNRGGAIKKAVRSAIG